MNDGYYLIKVLKRDEVIAELPKGFLMTYENCFKVVDAWILKGKVLSADEVKDLFKPVLVATVITRKNKKAKDDRRVA